MKPKLPIRVAVYARQSVASDLQFSSCEAQRDAVLSFVQSQRGEGWQALPMDYSDAGFSGSNVERPGFQRLMGDVAQKRVDLIAVYRIDRISRSVSDFTRFVDLLDRANIGFVSITESFDTRTSAGRLMLNILASFSQFERESIAQRTRDKIHATRKRGCWTGGRAILGYDAIDKKLVVNAAEAETVRTVFATYLRTGSLVETCSELRRLGVANKSGRPFEKSALHAYLQNAVLNGRMRCGHEVVPGIHTAIIDDATWQATQGMLRRGNDDTRKPKHTKWSAMLTGLLRCARCGAPMGHAVSTKCSGRQHRFYVCATSQKQGAAACPRSRAPAGEIESFVVDKIRTLSRDQHLMRDVVAATRVEAERIQAEAEEATQRLAGEQRRLDGERRNLLTAVAGGTAPTSVVARLLELDAEIAAVAERVRTHEQALAKAQANTIQADDVRKALQEFTPVWDTLFPAERARILNLLISEIRFDGQAGTLDVDFRAGGVRDIAMKKETA